MKVYLDEEGYLILVSQDKRWVEDSFITGHYKRFLRIEFRTSNGTYKVYEMNRWIDVEFALRHCQYLGVL